MKSFLKVPNSVLNLPSGVVKTYCMMGIMTNHENNLEKSYLEIASMLNIGEASIKRHISILVGAGLIWKTRKEYTNSYHFEAGKAFAVLSAPMIIDVDKAQIKVLIALSSYADKDGFSFPHLSTIGKKAGLSRIRVSIICKKLSECGMISITRRVDTVKMGWNKSNLYRVMRGYQKDKQIGIKNVNVGVSKRLTITRELTKVKTRGDIMNGHNQFSELCEGRAQMNIDMYSANIPELESIIKEWVKANGGQRLTDFSQWDMIAVRGAIGTYGLERVLEAIRVYGTKINSMDHRYGLQGFMNKAISLYSKENKLEKRMQELMDR